MNLLDGAVAIAIINLVSMLVNIYWTVRFRNIQGNEEMLKSLNEQNRAKDEIIKDQQDSLREKGRIIVDLMSKKNMYKTQYLFKHSEHERLKGRVSEMEKKII